MNIRNLNLLLTYRCPSRCRHCAYFSSLDGMGLMTALDVNRYLEALKGHPIRSLWIYGGEPFLYPGVLIEVVKLAKSRPIDEIGILTNGYWSKNTRFARKILLDLKEAGLSSMIISTGGSHAEWIRPELAVKAAHFALEMKLEHISFSVSFIPPRGASHPFNDRSEEIWEDLEQASDVPIRENIVLIVGRAAEELVEFCHLRKVRNPSGCRPPDYIGGSWGELEGLEIDPYGWAMICPGLSLGRVGQVSLAGLLEEYEQSGNFLWQALRYGCPAGLLELAQEKGYILRDGYAGRCHLCYDVRKYLRPYYAQNLAPENCYRELGRGRHTVT